MPKLIKLYEKYADQRSRFEILAFHDDQAGTFDELDEKLVDIIRDKWDGKPLPFPILLDDTGQTLENWGISAFPTIVLIDPDGKLVKGNAQEMLEEVLEKFAAEKEQVRR